MSTDFDVIVVGAGFSGLQAARDLQQAGKHVLVLEARERVGGRTKLGSVAGVAVDVGGMWLGQGQHRLKALAEHYGVARYPTFLDGNTVLSLSGKSGAVPREDFTKLLSLSENLQALWLLRRIQKLLDGIDAQNPWVGEKARQLDAQTLESWLRASVKSARLRSLLRVVCASLFCAEASQVSLLFFAVYLKWAGGLEAMISAEPGGAQHELFHGGVQQIASRMAAELGDAVRLQEPVTAIDSQGTGVRVQAQSGAFTAARVIVAIPPTLMHRIAFTPSLPADRTAYTQRLVMGSVIKYWVAYPTPFWRELGFNGSIVRDDRAATPCFDVTPPGSGVGLLAGFFDGDHAVHHRELSREARREVVTSLLAEHFGEPARTPLDYVDEDWTQAHWSKGCYGAFAPPGVMTHYGHGLLAPHYRVHWAGTESATQWSGYIEGALQAGGRAAAEVVKALV